MTNEESEMANLIWGDPAPPAPQRQAPAPTVAEWVAANTAPSMLSEEAWSARMSAAAQHAASQPTEADWAGFMATVGPAFASRPAGGTQQ